VTLVGVVNADVGLHVPDFRASERTFQFSPRWRGERAVARARQGAGAHLPPDHPAIALAGLHDFSSFVAAEMVHRRAHNYPPFQRLIRIIVRSRDQQEAGDFSETMAARVPRRPERRKQEGRQTGRCACSAGGGAGVPAEGLLSLPLQLQSASPRELHS